METEERSYFQINEWLIDLNQYNFVKDISHNENTSCILVKDKQNAHQYLIKTYLQTNYLPESKEETKAYNDYIFTLTQLDHPTIIKFYGFSYKDFNGDKNFSIVLKYTENGSLLTFLENCRKSLSPVENSNTIFQIILLGIVRSMMIFNKYKKINGNLKPENILLDENYHPKLTDFYTLTKPPEIKNDFSIYNSPEMLNNEHLTEKSDVYSFGIIMYEIVTLLTPFQEISELNSFQKITEIKRGLRPEFKIPINEKMKELIERCWSSKIEERPSFEELFYKLAYDSDFFLEGVFIDDVMIYIEKIKYDPIFCTICHMIINEDDLVYFSGFSYHKKCVKCSICNKNAIVDNDLIRVATDLFFCKQHFDEIEDSKNFPKDKYNEYCDKMMKNIIDNIFNSNIFNNNDQILNFRPEEIFIDSELIQNSFQIDKPYEFFLPVITVHYGADVTNINFDKLQELLGKELIIFGAKKGSIILKIAYIASNSSNKLKENHQKIFASIKNNLESSLINKPICSNLFDPEFSIPDQKTIEKFYKTNSFNHLQNFEYLNQIKIDEIKENVCSILKDENHKKNWEFFFKHQDLFDKIEKQVREDIKNNKIEIIIIGQTVIANKHLDEYEKIKDILQENAYEQILYHGSKLSNHYGIIKEHFRDPGYDDINQHDEGYFGKGIYATDNIFYSTYYTFKNCQHLKANEIAPIICCQTIYNKNETFYVKKKIIGQEIDDVTKDEYGINFTYVGNYNKYQEPVTKEEYEKAIVGSKEFVFPNKFQIIPLCSFKVKRAEYLILWKDENIYNEENTKFWKRLKMILEANFYIAKSNEEALDIIKLKMHNKIKLITNGGEKLTGKQFIKETRKIIGSNFICLVFAKDKKHLEWVTKMENVIFTNRPPIFYEFANLNMKDNLILDFVDKLKKEYNVNFKINKKKLFKFPKYFDEE